jgi:hypothetical protein
MVETRIEGLKEVMEGLIKAGATDKWLDKFADRFLLKVEKESKKAITQMNAIDTGLLRRSIYARRGGVARGYVSTNTNYAKHVHEGEGSNYKYGKRRFMDSGLELAYDSVELELDKYIYDMFK